MMNNETIQNIDDTVYDYSICNLTTSVVVAQNTLGDYTKVSSDAYSRLKVAIPITLFDELVTVPTINVFSGNFLYDKISNQKFSTDTETNGTLTIVDSLCNLNITSDNGSAASLTSKQIIQYIPGTSNCLRFSAIFNTGVASSIQKAGFDNILGGYSFGYDGVNFGINHSHSGKIHSVLLTITTASTAATNATITLNSVVFVVPLTNSGAAGIPFTAYEIANFSYTNWTATNVGNTVVFTYSVLGPQSGTYTFSHGTAVGTFSTLITGVVLTNEWTHEADFNVNPALSQGINKQLGNIYEIHYSWLGFNNIRFLMFNPSIAEPEIVHEIRYPNTSIIPSTQIPNFNVKFSLTSEGSTTAMSLNTASIGGFTYGSIPRFTNPNFSNSSLKSILADTETNILAVKVRSAMNGIIVKSSIILDTISVSCDGTKPVRIRLVLNPTTMSASTTTNYSKWEYADEDNSLTVIDTLAITYTGGIVLASYFLSKNGTIEKQYERGDFTLYANDVLLLSTFSTGASDIAAHLSWIERF